MFENEEVLHSVYKGGIPISWDFMINVTINGWLLFKKQKLGDENEYF